MPVRLSAYNAVVVAAVSAAVVVLSVVSQTLLIGGILKSRCVVVVSSVVVVVTLGCCIVVVVVITRLACISRLRLHVVVVFVGVVAVVLRRLVVLLGAGSVFVIVVLVVGVLRCELLTVSLAAELIAVFVSVVQHLLVVVAADGARVVELLVQLVVAGLVVVHAFQVIGDVLVLIRIMVRSLVPVLRSSSGVLVPKAFLCGSAAGTGVVVAVVVGRANSRLVMTVAVGIVILEIIVGCIRLVSKMVALFEPVPSSSLGGALGCSVEPEASTAMTGMTVSVTAITFRLSITT